MNQDNPHARGLDINQDWIEEAGPITDEAMQWIEGRFEQGRKKILSIKVELTDRAGLNLLNPEE